MCKTGSCDNSCFIEKLKDHAEKLKEDSVVVKVCKKPCYLSCFLINEDQNSDIVFIYKTIDKLDETTEMMKTVSLLEPTADPDISGNPLEAPFDSSDEYKIEELTLDHTILQIPEVNTHFPIASSSALSLLNYSISKLKPHIPLWILHDSSDLQKSILLGTFVEDDWYTRSWVNILEKSNAELTIENLLSKHYSYSMVKNKAVAEVACRFTLSHMNQNFCSDVNIHATWNKPSVKIPVDGGTSMSLELNVKVGEETNDLYVLWQQLLLIKNYYDIILQWKKDNSHPLPQFRAKVNLPTSAEIFDNKVELPLSEKIINALMSPNQWHTDCEKVNSFKEILTLIKNGTTPGIDLISRLWILLTECSTYEELAVNIGLIFQQVRKCTVDPFINVHNNSKLGEAIRTLLSDRSANPQLMLEPLELLIEIGIEKLKNDYITLFVLSGVANEEYLNLPNVANFVRMDNATWIESINLYLNWMSKIHAIAELVSLSLNITDITPDKATIIKRIFSHYLSSSSPVYSLQNLCENLNLKFVTPIISFQGQSTRNLKYDKWLMKLTTKQEYFSVTTCFLRTMSCNFPENMLFNNPGNMTFAADKTVLDVSNSDDRYFCAELTSISNKIGIK